jgi:hypothetical protein
VQNANAMRDCATTWKVNMSIDKPAKKRRRPPFVPTQEQRAFVNRMAGTRMTVADICLVIGISRRTAYKYFSDEIKAGSARFHALVTNELVKAVKRGAPWAIQTALRNLERFRWDRYDKGAMPYIANNDDTSEIKITFHPGPGNKPSPIDVTPSPYAGHAPDYSKPAIEPPPPRQTTASGAIYEHREPPTVDPYGHLPKWHGPKHVDNTQGGEGTPGSIWDRGDPSGWMK